MFRFLALAVLALVFVLIDAAPASAQVFVGGFGAPVVSFRRARVGFVGGGFAPVGVGFHQPAVVGFAPRVGFAPVGYGYGFSPVGLAPVHATVGGFQGYGAVPLGGFYGAPAFGAPACHTGGGGGTVIQGSFGY